MLLEVPLKSLLGMMQMVEGSLLSEYMIAWNQEIDKKIRKKLYKQKRICMLN